MDGGYILIGADIVPTKSNAELFANGNIKELVGEDIEKLLKEASYRIFNLEVPLTDKEEPILKRGPNLIASTKAIAGYKALGIDLCTIANNHILDQGEQGLFSTVKTLDKAGINYVGAGKNIHDAGKPFVFEFMSQKIGVYACSEHEFTIASDKRAGANPFDPLWSLDHVATLKEKVDYEIVLFHGGREHYRYPSPNLQKVCRRIVDKGADLVVCQHTHCIGCEEKYNGGTIVYGQGNFIFDNSDNECWQTGMLIKIDKNMEISYIPLIKKKNVIRIPDDKNGKQIMYGFLTRSEQIKKIGFIEEEYLRLANNKIVNLERIFSGRNSFIERCLDKLTCGNYHKIKFGIIYNRKSLLAILNHIECEAHNELCKTALINQINKYAEHKK